MYAGPRSVRGSAEQCTRVTVLFLSFLGTFPIGYVSYCISMYLECILMCILMCPVHIHQDTSRYTKIHQDTLDTFVSIYLAIMELYLTLGYVSFFKIHLGYIYDTFQDTMYLNPQIHDTQETLTIHEGYMYIGIHSRIRISSPTCGRAWMRAGATPFPLTPEIRIPYVSLMYPPCIPHVSLMYLDYP